MSKYDKYKVTSMDTSNQPKTDGVKPTFIFGKETFEEAPYHVEITTITGNCSMMAGTDKGEEKKVIEDSNYFYGYNGPYPRYTMEADRYIFFFGTNLKDLRDLGAHVEFHMGDDVRDEEEIFHFDEPRCIYVPQGVRFGPIKVSNFKQNVIMFDIIAAPSLKEGKVVPDFTYFSEYRDQMRLKAQKEAQND
ncbi:MAG: hypothetical protein LUF35_08060 [Lachnospiraceae bacterium]|nr:hypothetical protein [Lachnospiraceae bacterium]